MNLTEQSNLSDLLVERARATPEAPAYRRHDGARWVDWTWGEVAHVVGRWRAAFKKEGLKPGDRVALCLRNRTEWVVFDQAALELGLVSVPLYFDDRPDNMAWCLNDAGARLLLVEDSSQWAALKAITRTIERVIYLEGAALPDASAARLEDWRANPWRARPPGRTISRPSSIPRAPRGGPRA